jgi:RimJ/RimL family protein N-acetyltransferase
MYADIVTPRLRLRRLRPADVPELRAYRSDSEVARFQVWSPATEDEVADFVAEQARMEPDIPGTWFQLGVALRAAESEHKTDALAGDCGLHFPPGEPWQTEVGITLAAWAQGRGYAREALAAIFGYLFDTLGKHRVFASVDPRNAPSIALLEHLGMRREAHFRESLWDKGEWCDDFMYAVLEDEWRASRKRRMPGHGGARDEEGDVGGR